MKIYKLSFMISNYMLGFWIRLLFSISLSIINKNSELPHIFLCTGKQPKVIVWRTSSTAKVSMQEVAENNRRFEIYGRHPVPQVFSLIAPAINPQKGTPLPVRLVIYRSQHLAAVIHIPPTNSEPLLLTSFRRPTFACGV